MYHDHEVHVHLSCLLPELLSPRRYGDHNNTTCTYLRMDIVCASRKQCEKLGD